MGARVERAQQVRHREQMLLGVSSTRGVLPLDFKPAHSVGDLLVQHVDELEQEAEEKGGIRAVLSSQFAKVYRVPLSLAA